MAGGRVWAVAAATVAIHSSCAVAADLPSATSGAAPTDSSASWLSEWFNRVDEAQATQPHWITPLVTVTPRLEEEVRYDQLWQTLGNGATIDNFGGGKGLELIPTTTNEVILGVPPYMVRDNVKPASGFGDWPVALIKQRLHQRQRGSGQLHPDGFSLGFGPYRHRALHQSRLAHHPDDRRRRRLWRFQRSGHIRRFPADRQPGRSRHGVRDQRRVSISFRQVFLAGNRTERHLLGRRLARRQEPAVSDAGHRPWPISARRPRQTDRRRRLSDCAGTEPSPEAGAHPDLQSPMDHVGAGCVLRRTARTIGNLSQDIRNRAGDRAFGGGADRPYARQNILGECRRVGCKPRRCA